MPVIAMTREMGSLGRDVASILSENLGLKLVQHELVAHVAEKMHKRESSVNRFLEGQAGLLERWGINEDDMSLYTAEEILDLAEAGNVLIRGWGATHVLSRCTHVLCVRICAPERVRAQVLMKRIGVDDSEVALREIQRNDAAHSRAMHNMFHTDYRDPEGYDVVLNTEGVSVETCTSVIESLVGRPEFQETEESRRALRTRRIEAHIKSALNANPVTSRPSGSLYADFEDETATVALTGVAADQKFRDEAEQIVRGVKGVNDVRNELIVVGNVNRGP